MTDQHPQDLRSRFGNIVNADALPWEGAPNNPPAYEGEGKSIAQRLKARQLGYHIERLPAGKISVPFHFHHAQEEMFYVLEGYATVRQGNSDGEERIEVGPGDVISFPPGTGIAHQFINHTSEPFVFLAVSTREQLEVVEYPDSDKMNLWANRRTVRRGPDLDYWEGEVPPRTATEMNLPKAEQTKHDDSKAELRPAESPEGREKALE